MTSVLLIYPFFRGRRDRSRFRFPPLGVAYVAAALRDAGPRGRAARLHLPDRDDALRRARAARAEVVGIYAMATLTRGLPVVRRRSCAAAATCWSPAARCRPASPRRLPRPLRRRRARRGRADDGRDRRGLRGGADPERCRRRARGVVVAPDAAVGASPTSRPAPRSRPPRRLAPASRSTAASLDGSPFPPASCCPTSATSTSAGSAYGYAITTVMSTRGCPFDCEFCSNVVFGDSYRERSPGNVRRRGRRGPGPGLRPHLVRRRRVHA